MTAAQEPRMRERGWQTLRVEIAGPVATIVLDRPERLNALSAPLLEELVDVVDGLAREPQVRAVILRGAGRAFSGGFDLGDFAAAMEQTPEPELCDLGRRAAASLTAMPQIAIAAIHGPCVGGAVVLAACCDLRIAARSASFSIPEVDLGIPLAWSGIPRLVRELGPAVTKDLVLTCRTIGADDARALRFVSAVVPDERLLEEAARLAESIAAKPRFAVQLTKRHVDVVAEEGGPTAHSFREAHAFLQALNDGESRARMSAYLQAHAQRSRA